jgi:hypothetical protein
MLTAISSVPNQNTQLYRWILTSIIQDPLTMNIKLTLFLISETILMQTHITITAWSIKICMIRLLDVHFFLPGNIYLISASGGIKILNLI